ncbi:MAG: carbon storage regulator [Rubripirellula sp.]
MLVLSRRKGESIEFAGMEIAIRVVSLSKSKVQLGIDAPREVVINRSEKLTKGTSVSPTRPKEPDLSAQVLEELARIESELAALAELASPKERKVARTVAADAIARLEGIERTVRMSRPRHHERPIAEFVKSVEPPTSCVQQSEAIYTIDPTPVCVA